MLSGRPYLRLGNARCWVSGICYHPEAAPRSTTSGLAQQVRRWDLVSSGGYVVGSGCSRASVGADTGRWCRWAHWTLLQIAIGIVDLGLCVARDVLSRTSRIWALSSCQVIFVSADIVGFASHSPAGRCVRCRPCWSACGRMDKEDLLPACAVACCIILPPSSYQNLAELRRLSWERDETLRAMAPSLKPKPAPEGLNAKRPNQSGMAGSGAPEKIRDRGDRRP